MPLMLFQFRIVLLRRATPSSPSRDRGVEALIRAGFSRLAHGVALCKPVPGWTVTITADHEALLADSGDPVCVAAITMAPHWLAAATRQQRSLVLYGPRLGALSPCDGHAGTVAA